MNTETYKLIQDSKLRLDFDQHFSAISAAQQKAQNTLTKEQVFSAFCQAIAAGDFERLVMVDGSQQVIYIPGREVERLRRRIHDLEECLAQNNLSSPQDNHENH